MSAVGYYDREGKEISLLHWAHLWDDWNYRCIALTDLPGGARVITVWEGIQSPCTLGIFHTAYLPAGGVHHLDELSTNTEASARLAHKAMVAKAEKSR